jgi:hypothetical protein
MEERKDFDLKHVSKKEKISKVFSRFTSLTSQVIRSKSLKHGIK